MATAIGVGSNVKNLLAEYLKKTQVGAGTGAAGPITTMPVKSASGVVGANGGVDGKLFGIDLGSTNLNSPMPVTQASSTPQGGFLGVPGAVAPPNAPSTNPKVDTFEDNSVPGLTPGTAGAPAVADPTKPATTGDGKNPASGTGSTPMVQYSNEYMEKAGQLMTQLESMMGKNFSFDATKDPTYLAAQQMATAGAQKAKVGAMETMNDRGIMNSTLMGSQLGQIEQDAALKPLELIPQLQAQAYGQYQDGISNMGTLMNTYLQTGQNQLDYAQNKSYQDAMISGKWVSPELQLLLNKMLGGGATNPDGTPTTTGAPATGGGGTAPSKVVVGSDSYSFDAQGNIFKNGTWISSSDPSLPKSVTDQSKSVKTGTGTTSGGGSTPVKVSTQPVQATPAASTNPNATVLGGQSYSVSATGEIFKNGVHVPAENIKYIPPEVVAQAKANKKP